MINAFSESYHRYSGMSREACGATLLPVAICGCGLLGIRTSAVLFGLALRGAIKVSEAINSNVINQEYLADILHKKSDEWIASATTNFKRDFIIMGSVLLGSCCTTVMEDPESYTIYRKIVEKHKPKDEQFNLRSVEELAHLFWLLMDGLVARV